MWIWNSDGNLTNVKIERNESLQINALEYGKKELVPIRVSKKYNTDFDVHLFLLEDGLTHHYVLITNLKKSNLPRKWSNSAIGRFSLPKLLSFMFFKGNIRVTHCELFQQWTCIDTDAKARGKQNERHKLSSSMVRSISYLLRLVILLSSGFPLFTGWWKSHYQWNTQSLWVFLSGGWAW